jgi:hypothetical protein
MNEAYRWAGAFSAYTTAREGTVNSAKSLVPRASSTARTEAGRERREDHDRLPHPREVLLKGRVEGALGECAGRTYR